MSSLDGIRLPLTILLGALIIGGIIGVVGINMQPKYDDSRLQPITVETPTSTRPAAPATASGGTDTDIDSDHRGIDYHRRSGTATGNLRSDRDDRRWGPP